MYKGEWMIDRLKSIALVFSVFVLLNCGPKSGKPESSKLVQDFVAQVETLDSMTVASLNRTGPYSSIEPALIELNDWLKSNNITPTGVPFVFYYDNPQTVAPESCNWAVCVPVPAATTSGQMGAIVVNKLPVMDIAWTIHTGGYENVQSTYNRLLEWIDEEGYEVVGPAVEFFLSEKGTPAESMKTKIGFVVEPQPESGIEEVEGEDSILEGNGG